MTAIRSHAPFWRAHPGHADRGEQRDHDVHDHVGADGRPKRVEDRQPGPEPWTEGGHDRDGGHYDANYHERPGPADRDRDCGQDEDGAAT